MITKEAEWLFNRTTQLPVRDGRQRRLYGSTNLDFTTTKKDKTFLFGTLTPTWSSEAYKDLHGLFTKLVLSYREKGQLKSLTTHEKRTDQPTGRALRTQIGQ